MHPGHLLKSWKQSALEHLQPPPHGPPDIVSFRDSPGGAGDPSCGRQHREGSCAGFPKPHSQVPRKWLSDQCLDVYLGLQIEAPSPGFRQVQNLLLLWRREGLPLLLVS